MGNVRAIYLNDQGESKRRMSADIMYIIVDKRIKRLRIQYPCDIRDIALNTKTRPSVL